MRSAAHPLGEQSLIGWGACPAQLDVGYLSAPEAVEFPTEGGKTAFMNYYAPKNKDYTLPSGHKPPLLVKIHGGPTSQASTGFNLALQFWTSRGWCVCGGQGKGA